MSWLDRWFPPPKSVASLRRGARAAVRGRVVPRDLIDSPLEGEQCVHYRFVVEEWRDPSVLFPGAGGNWHLLHLDEAMAEFYLRDKTGQVIVAPERADVTDSPLSPRYVRARDRLSEWTIRPGDLVEVIGDVDETMDLLDCNRGYREGAQRLILRAPARGWLRIKWLGRRSD